MGHLQGPCIDPRQSDDKEGVSETPHPASLASFYTTESVRLKGRAYKAA